MRVPSVLFVIARVIGGSHGDEGLTLAVWRWIPAGALYTLRVAVGLSGVASAYLLMAGR